MEVLRIVMQWIIMEWELEVGRHCLRLNLLFNRIKYIMNQKENPFSLLLL